MDKKTPSLKFTNFHNHDTFSIFDGIGYPEEHIDFAYKNGLDGIAFTNHGNMNSFSYAFIKDKKMKEEGKDFKVMYGVESYVHPDINVWREEYKKYKDKTKHPEDDTSGLVVEDESETKKGIQNELKNRSHLVMVAQNQVGLKNLFKLVSESYKDDNFYRFPRMDFEMMKKYNEGIIVSSACLGGILSNDYWRNKDNGDKAVLSAMSKTVTKMMEIYGDRFYGELQWSMIPEQHIVNQFIIQLSKQHGFDLITTCDAHYPSPDLWKDREIYKMLGWLNKNKDAMSLSNIPSSLENMDYQLYPKNGDELFEYYKKTSSKLGFSYNDQIVADSIERTSDIAKNRIEKYTLETGIKLPSFVLSEGELEKDVLDKFSLEGLTKLKLDKDPTYVSRMKEELSVIGERGFCKYFLTMKMISDKISADQIVNPGRGSGAGSLISYLLGITQLDPIKYKLQFSRFIRQGEAVGFKSEELLSLPKREVEKTIKITTDEGIIEVTPNTTFTVIRDNRQMLITADKLHADDTFC